MADLDKWLAKAEGTVEGYIAGATGLAASYLSRYRDFFTTWDGANAPAELKAAVASLAVMEVASASGNLAPQALDESIWERRRRAAIQWLRDLATGAAELDVDWGLEDEEPSGHRARMSINKGVPA